MKPHTGVNVPGKELCARLPGAMGKFSTGYTGRSYGEIAKKCLGWEWSLSICRALIRYNR